LAPLSETNACRVDPTPLALSKLPPVVPPACNAQTSGTGRPFLDDIGKLTGFVIRPRRAKRSATTCWLLTVASSIATTGNTLLKAVDQWIAGQNDPDFGRSEAIRRLVEIGLKAMGK
jgi:hypothetical protein